MTQYDLLTLLQTDLNLLSPDANRVSQLTYLLSAAEQMIAREGVTLQEPYTIEDGQLIVMYASYLYRKRATNEPMPRMLRWALNNRIFSHVASGGDTGAT